MSDELVCIRTYESRIEAGMAAGVLSSNEIPVEVMSDDAGGTTPALLTVTGGAKIMVRAKDAKRADELLNAIELDSVDVAELDDEDSD